MYKEVVVAVDIKRDLYLLYYFDSSLVTMI